MVFVTDGSDASESYPRYIVKLQNTTAAGMDERECPLCHEKLFDIPERKPTVFLAHLSLAKAAHNKCSHSRMTHLDFPAKGLG
jgi:hypothetical protein